MLQPCLTHPSPLTRVVLAPSFVGGPSVIPFGVGEGNLENGVVQIPLRYTVGETVDFIRTIATVDKNYLRTVPDAGARATEGGSDPAGSPAFDEGLPRAREG